MKALIFAAVMSVLAWSATSGVAGTLGARGASIDAAVSGASK